MEVPRTVMNDKNVVQKEVWDKVYRDYINTGDEAYLWKLWPMLEILCGNIIKKASNHHKVIDYEDVLRDSVLACIEAVRRKRDKEIKCLPAYFRLYCLPFVIGKKKQFHDRVDSLPDYDVEFTKPEDVIIIKGE